MIQVLFICTGNVHRSVLAERLLAAKLPHGSAMLPVSAGTEARPRSGMENATRVVLEKLGGNGSGFETRALSAQLVTEAALVLGLAREHREAAVQLAPSAMRRCFTLKEFVRLAARGADVARDVGGFTEVVSAAAARRGIAGPVPPDEDDVADPRGRPPRVLFDCACEIAGEVSRLIRLLDGGGAGR